MSEYRNDPTIDFLLDEGSKDYANRYNQHIHAMTAEGLSGKSDIAWELTIRDQRIAELEEDLKSARNDGFDMCKADYREQFAEYDERIAELEEQNKRLVEMVKTSVAEFDDGIKYPLEVVNDLKKVLASVEKDDV